VKVHSDPYACPRHQNLTKSVFCWFGGRGLGRYYNGKHSSAFALAEVAKEKFSIGNLVVA
jgi:hypothetical protein